MENYEINLPYSLEAEQAVLGSILIDPSCLELIQSKGFSPEYFFRTEHKAIFNAMLKIQALSQTIDPLLVLENLKADPSFDEAAGKNYLFELSQVVPSTANVESYAKIIKDKFFTRTLINVSREILNDATSGDIGAEVLLNSAEQKIYDIRQGKTSNDVAKLADVITDTVYDRLEKLNSPDPAVRDQFKGFTTGFSDLDRLTSGLNKADLIIVGARPAMGKTAFVLSMAKNMAIDMKIPVAVFSLEMSNVQLINRLISNVCEIDSKKIKSGQLENGNADITHLRQAQDIICTQMKLYGNDYASISPAEIASQCRRLKAQEGLDLIIIDYIQLMTSGVDPKQGRQNEVASITRALKLLAKDLNVPIIALSQLKRDAETRNIKDKDAKAQGGSEPVLSDLRESGAIEQDADIVLFIHKEQDSDGSYKYKLIIAKHRNGEQDNIDLYWLGSIVRFADEDYLLQHNIRRIVTAQPTEQEGEDQVFDDSSEQQTEFIANLDDDSQDGEE